MENIFRGVLTWRLKLPSAVALRSLDEFEIAVPQRLHSVGYVGVWRGKKEWNAGSSCTDASSQRLGRYRCVSSGPSLAQMCQCSSHGALACSICRLLALTHKHGRVALAQRVQHDSWLDPHHHKEVVLQQKGGGDCRGRQSEGIGGAALPKSFCLLH